MNKNKYKLGTMIQYTRQGTADHGIINGIIIREDGVSYEVDENTINENDILNAYKPIAARKARAKTVRVKKMKKGEFNTTLGEDALTHLIRENGLDSLRIK